MHKEVIIAIPARLNSKRLPGKVLEDIGGKTMLERVLEKVKKVNNYDNIFVFTDSSDVEKFSRNLGYETFLTNKNIKSGSERIASMMPAFCDFKNLENKVIINVQADQPFLNPDIVNLVIDKFLEDDSNSIKVVTPIYKLSENEIFNENVVKVIIDKYTRAIYFSRTAIPYIKNKKPFDWHLHNDYWGHIGIYGYRGDILNKWNSYEISKLEELENLEQLRLIYSNVAIHTVVANDSCFSIDTQEQLDMARLLFKKLD